MIDDKEKPLEKWFEIIRTDSIYYECSNCGNVEKHKSQFCRICGKEMHNEEIDNTSSQLK